MTEHPDIVSPANRRVTHAAKLARASARASEGKILLEGRHLLDEALAAHLTPLIVFVLEAEDGATARVAGSEVLTVSERVMAKLATTQHPTGPVAVIQTPPLAERPSGSAVVLWGVGDPGNVGTAIRSTIAFGVTVVVGPGCADLWSPKVLRAAAGAHFRGTVVAASDLTLDDLRRWGLRTIAAVPDGGLPVAEVLVDEVAVMVGAEGGGLPSKVVAAADGAVTIPMPGGVESLNAGVTASIVAYELMRGNGSGSGRLGD